MGLFIFLDLLFRLLSFQSPLICNHDFQRIRIDSILFPVMAESNLPTTEEELDLNNEPPVTGERKRPLYDSFEVVVRPLGRKVKYIFDRVQ